MVQANAAGVRVLVWGWLAVAACTRAAEPVAEEKPVVVDVPVAAAPVVAGPVAVVKPDVDAPVAVGSTAGFVVVGRDETIVVPVDPSVAPLRAAGIWVLDDAVVPASVRFHWFGSLQSPECACAGATRACRGTVVVDGGDGPICECRAVERGVEDDEDTDSDTDAALDIEDCESAENQAVSLVGGSLYFHVVSHAACGETNSYDIRADEEAMVAGAVDLSKRTMKLAGCDPGVFMSDDLWPLPGVCTENCRGCDEIAVEATVFALERGRLVRAESEVQAVGGGARRVFAVDVDPSTCPSPADTCGPVARFPGIEAAERFWIANDGSAALRSDKGALSVLAGAAVVDRGAVGKVVLGVRWHADVRTLIDVMRARAPRSRALAVCATNDECGDDPGCSLRCEHGACVANATVEPVELAIADFGFVDEHGGRDWGTRCVEHLRAGRVGAAQAACEAGLAIAVKPGIRGALFYNLGVLARRTGDDAKARVRFTESLAVRPGNAAVTAALAELAE